MTYSSNKKRRGIFVKITKPPKLNDAFFKNLKKNILKEYETHLKSHLEKMNQIQESIKKPEESEMRNKKSSSQQNEYFIFAHQKVVQISLIESISIFDFNINHALEEYQKYKQNKQGKEIRAYWKVENGINECLKGLNQSLDFSKRYDVVKYFRILRHKFAHGISSSADMVLFIEPKDEEFESFLEQLEGIIVNKQSFWTQSTQGEIGGFVFYRITSDKFIYFFFEESFIFFKMLLEILFPTEAKFMSSQS